MDGIYTSYIIPGLYYGQPSDYYEFLLNKELHVHENGNDASSTYQVLPNSKLFIAAIVEFENATIQKLTSTEATFYWTDTSANGGTYARTLELKK